MTKLGNINSQTDMVDSVNGQTGVVVVNPVIPGGTTSQKLTKKSATDGDTQWSPPWAENAYVGTDAPTGTPKLGDVWFDTDDPNPLTLPLSIVSGGTGATTPAGARAGFAVPAIGNSTTTAGAPTTGTWARGDQYLDSANVVWTCVTAGTPGTWTAPPGTELVYAQITANVSVTAASAAGADLVINGGTRTFDGSPIRIEYYTMIVQAPAVANNGTYITLWDNANDVGALGDVFNGSAVSIATPVCVRRRYVPTAGSHNFRIGAWVQAGTGIVYAGPGGAGAFSPAYMRITRA